jgi:hypothetical protein
LLLTGYPEVIGFKGLLSGDFGHLGQKKHATDRHSLERPLSRLNAARAVAFVSTALLP